jgi:RNA-splicing ligase RtcB
MERLVHLFYEGAVDVGVDMGGDDGAVAEHLLHGAGRRMSRTKAKQMVQGSQLRRELEAMGVSVQG